ncbi:MARVEL domain-containing protein [Dictyobacter kobayashii]|uniref:CvpA family protein n=1 Tax=Dictyobacter kobayashii TaxID=2014872 RepID=A0A402AF77_9CHLR|nr:MARVEL domain-containing protein [Dictyobacter kobayashii]GCE17770.1 hypothetical protein KDK_15700 [Dictyobacter kobayashii]
MIILLLALIGTLIVMACLTSGRLFFGRKEPFEARPFTRWFVGFSIFNYVFSLLILYFSEPAFTGPFWGWQWVLWPLLISSIINLFAIAGGARGALEMGLNASQGQVYTRPDDAAKGSRRAIAAGIFGLVIVAVFGIAATLLINIFTTWFDGNAKALAAIPHVINQPSPDLPPTDAKNIVLVSQSIASYKGQQVLGSTGQNLGSAYQLDPTSYTLQSINHHLYYVAELSYNNLFVNLSNPTTPGFVMVDAEDPQQAPQLHTEPQSSIRYLPGALLNQDLLRHVYLSGYTYGRLVDPTLELDDSLHPYWTISLMQPSRGYTGDVLSKVLLVDAHTGDIKEYSPQNVPTWVDRVMPAETVSQYLSWWGLYHAAPWFNPSGLGQQSPASAPELLYNNADQPVWLIPMSSASSNDNSSTGVFLFDTHKNEANFYSKSAGLGIGDNVTKTFQSTRANIRGYNVASVQLYQIYSTPTWVAIYTQSTASGDIFQAVGLVDARELNGNNVQFDPDLASGLRDYQQWLTSQASNGNAGGSTNGQPLTVTGKVLRISSVQQGTSTVYYLQIAGQPFIFTANLSLSPKLPLVQSGDTVTITYNGGSGTVVNLKTFDDTSINLGASAPPAATPTPSAKK